MKVPLLDPWYVSGLVEGEGCFHVSFSLREKLRIGIETRPSFSISLNCRDLMLLQGVHQYFGCGAIRRSESDRTYKYEVRSISDLAREVIPHFERYTLHGSKRNDFVRFAEICRSISASRHLDTYCLKGIIESAFEMNPSGKRMRAKDDLLRVLDQLKV